MRMSPSLCADLSSIVSCYFFLRVQVARDQSLQNMLALEKERHALMEVGGTNQHKTSRGSVCSAVTVPVDSNQI